MEDLGMQTLDTSVREAAERMLARKGIEPDQLLDRSEAAALCGVAKNTLAKLAVAGQGPRYKVAFGRTHYVALDAAVWFQGQLREPADGPQTRTAQTRRARGDKLGRPPRGDAREAMAA
jgi:hypothetical protein